MIYLNAEEGREYINTQIKGGWYNMTMPISDPGQIKYILQGCDEAAVKKVIEEDDPWA